MKQIDKSITYAALAVLFWSTVATAFKIALRTLSPFELLQISVYTSTLILLIILILNGKLRQLKSIKLRDFRLYLILAILNPVLYYQILFIAYDRLPAQTAQVLNFTWPVMIVLFSYLFRLERVNWKKMAALSISFMGTFIVISGFSFNAFQQLDKFAALLAFSSSFIWAAFWIINKKNNHDPVLSLFWIFLIGSLLILSQSLITDQLPSNLTLSALLPAIYVGIFEMSLTFTLWLAAMKQAKNTALLSNLIYLSPFFSLIFIRLILQEIIHPETIAGLLLIVAGIVYQWRINHKEDKSFPQIKSGLK